MKTSLVTITLLASSFSSALAQPAETGLDRPMPAVDDSLELSLGGGFMQGAGGTAANTPDREDLGGAGGGSELMIGHRALPGLSVGGYLTLEGYTNGDAVSASDEVVGVSVGIKSDFHLRPHRTVDPWISTGFGVRWLTVGNTSEDKLTLRGLDLARLQLGVDYRINPKFAIAPFIGAAATLYLDKDTPMSRGYVATTERELSWTFTGGLLGRFNLR
jgi:hypothetical protein